MGEQKTDEEWKEQFEEKMAIYDYLFSEGNKNPKEDQVEMWQHYLEHGLRKRFECRELTVQEKAGRKKDLLYQVGLIDRAECIKRWLCKDSRPSWIEYRIQQLEAEVHRYTNLGYGNITPYIDIIIHDHIVSKNPRALKVLQQSGFGYHLRTEDLLANNPEEAVWNIEQLAHLGKGNEQYGIRVTKEGYKRARSNIRRKLWEEENTRKRAREERNRKTSQ